MTDIAGTLAVFLAFVTIINLVIFALMLKLYTEQLKDSAMNKRKEKS